MNSANLLPGDVLDRRARTRRLRIWAMIAAAYSVVPIGGYVYAVNADPGPREVEELLVKAESDLTSARESLKRAKESAGKAERELAAWREITVHPDWSVVLRLIAITRGEDVTIGTFALTPTLPPAFNSRNNAPDPTIRKPTGFTISITGRAASQARLLDFVEALEKSGIFAKVAQSDMAAADTGGVTYTLQCEMTAGAAAGANP